jgi:tetratricopeptide (TPR) repeat protein
MPLFVTATRHSPPQTAHRSIERLLLVATALALAGCASARLQRENQRALAEADAKVLEGCFRCLQDARATYARLATGKHALPKNTGPMSVRLFEVDVLLALRAKELGLDPRAALAEARSLTPRLPATLEPDRVLAMVEAVLPDTRALPMSVIDAKMRRDKAYVARMDSDLTWVERSPLSSPVRKYVALALDCSYPDRYKERGDSANPLARRRELPINAPPLLAYRGADCADSDTLALKRVLNAAPSFDEAAYALGNTVVWSAAETGGDDAVRYYARARARFPRSAGITFMSGWLDLTIGDCVEAVRFYDSTLALEPMHDRALLQKAICQSNMHQDSAAIATATRFISLGTSDVAQGYYWRAVSRLRRRELDLARDDAEAAKARSRGGDVLTIAGIVEHEQEDYVPAEADLRAARNVPKGSENCHAAFYLGSVLTKRQAWPEAAASYDSAMVCYDDRASFIAAKIEQVRASRRGSPEFKAKRIASLESDLADRRSRQRTSAFNAASMNARLDNFARAEELLQIAAQSPELAEKIDRLREEIARVPRPRR